MERRRSVFADLSPVMYEDDAVLLQLSAQFGNPGAAARDRREAGAFGARDGDCRACRFAFFDRRRNDSRFPRRDVMRRSPGLRAERY